MPKLSKPILAIVAIAAAAALTARSQVQDSDQVPRVVLQNLPVSVLMEYLPVLTGKPVLGHYPTPPGLVNFRAERDLTRAETIQGLDGALRTIQLTLVSVSNLYSKVTRLQETNQNADVPHLLIELDSNATIAVDGKPVASEQLSDTIQSRLAPETEIWIHDAAPSSSSNAWTSLTMSLANARVPRDRVYRLYLPKP